MRETFDVRSALVAAGAVLLLLSLFLEWYEPGLEAWTVFELVDVLLAGVAALALAAVVPGASPGLRRALPWLAFGALAVVLVQVIDPPPAASEAERAIGLLLALLATVLMAAGAALAVARISVVVDVEARERRRRAAAVDARGGAEAGTAVPAGADRPGAGAPATGRSGRLERLFSQGDPAGEDGPPSAAPAAASVPPPDPVTRAGAAAPPPADDADRTQPLRPSEGGAAGG